ncbi:hypothetical protein ACG04R_01295 [Roseateles sp. BYS78W]|uniref:GIY-YIG nuclease family protein n=1 Tax=Pelomonas candidula TaxID=3299025 RepID=A0ABW7H6I3_9BURK
MTIQIGSYAFDGPHPNAGQLAARSGVYAILGRHAPGATWLVLDIGESQDVRGRIDSHDRRPQWRRQGMPELACAAWYCAEPDRMRIEQQLRAQFNPPCGDR